MGLVVRVPWRLLCVAMASRQIPRHGQMRRSTPCDARMLTLLRHVSMAPATRHMAGRIVDEFVLNPELRNRIVAIDKTDPNMEDAS